jgi:hypothetical protein
LSSRGTAPEFVTLDLGNALVLFGYGLTSTGARVFDNRPIRPLLAMLAPAIWLTLWPAGAVQGAGRRWRAAS